MYKVWVYRKCGLLLCKFWAEESTLDELCRPYEADGCTIAVEWVEL